MLNRNDVMFGWYKGPGRYLTSRQYTPIKGPYYTHAQNQIGKAFAHTLDELLGSGVFSESKKKRLSTAKIGTVIELHSLHKTANLYLKRLSPEDIDALNEYNKNAEELSKVNEEILAATLELHRHQSKLQKAIKGSLYSTEEYF